MTKTKPQRRTPSVYSDEDGDNEVDSGSEADENEDGNDKMGSGDDSSDDGSGSDSSDMDVEDCDKRREGYIEDLTELENQFTILREQLYRERLTQIESKLSEVRAGKAMEYIQPLEELEENMRVQIEVGTILRQMRIENIQCKFHAEELACKQNYESEKELVYDSVKADLDEKILRLEEDKNNVDINNGLWELSARRNRKRQDSMDLLKRRKPVTVSGPYIVYMMQEADILDDWTQIRKSLVSQKSLEKLAS